MAHRPNAGCRCGLSGAPRLRRAAPALSDCVAEPTRRILLWLALASTATAVAAQVTAAQRATMLELFASTGGSSWRHREGWGGAAGTECSWFGVACEAGSLDQIDLCDNGLIGTLPALGGLAGIRNLYLCFNELGGPIPSLSSLGSLEELRLDGNALQGTIPSLATLSSLRSLELQENQLDGGLPDLSHNLGLESLNLSDNRLSGPIPPVAALTALRGLGLGGNQLSGTIPDLSHNVLLEQILLADNQLSGSIPPLNALHALEYFNVDDNPLTGVLPDFTDNVALIVLYVSRTRIGGTIPDLSKLTQLEELVLNSDRLEGGIPDLRHNTRLTFLDLYGNQLVGQLPALHEQPLLEHLWLGANRLEGTVPDYRHLSKLATLDLQDNRLDGAFPDVTSLKKLEWLSLSGNRLTGEIPDLRRLPELGYLTLGFNLLATPDRDLAFFIDGLDPFWEETQTVPPERLRVVPLDPSSVVLAWQPIRFRGFAGETGRYIVSSATHTDGPYTEVARTADKDTNQVTVSGLSPGQSVFFVVQSQSDPHDYNQSQLTSGPSAEADGAPAAVVIPTGAAQGVGTETSAAPVVVSDDAGRSAVVWQERQGRRLRVRVQIFDANGNALSQPLPVSSSGRDQSEPAASWTADGHLAVIWLEGSDAAGLSGAGGAAGSVLGRRFDPNGQPASPAKTLTAGGAAAPDLGADRSGGLVTTWQQGNRVMAQRFAGDFAPGAGPIEVTDEPGGSHPAVATDAAGGFVVLWESDGDPVQGRIRGRTFDRGGAMTRGTFALTTDPSAALPDVARSADGGIIAAWQALGSKSDLDVFGRLFDSEARPRTGTLRLNFEVDGDQTRPKVGANAAGDFGVAWQSDVSTVSQSRLGATVGGTVLGRFFDADGVPRGTDLTIATTDGGAEPAAPDLGLALDDQAVIAFERRGPGGLGEGVFRRRVDPTIAAGECFAGELDLCLNEERFRVSVSWQDPSGRRGGGQAAPLTGDTGTFWFFDPSNLELVIKVLDGCALNGRYWVFAGGLTDVEVTVEVDDSSSGLSRVYFNPGGTAFQPVQDTNAFASCPGGPGARPPLTTERLTRRIEGDMAALLASFRGTSPGASPGTASEHASAAEPAGSTAAACTDSTETLCLSGHRFQVRVDYQAPDIAGAGQAVSLTADSGYYWFFDAGNVEVLIKVLDACAINERFWVFAGGLTDVGVDIIVTDTATGAQVTYRNQPGTPFQPIQDTGAFETCG